MNTEEFIDRLKKINSDLIVLGEYVNMKTKILVEDPIGIKYEAFPEALLKGSTPKITSALNPNEAFKMKLKEISPSLKVVSEYVHANQDVIVEDELGIQYRNKPSSLLLGNIPSIKSAIDQTDAFKKMVYNKRDDCEIIDEYKGDRHKILVKDNLGIEYRMVPYNLLQLNHSLTIKGALNKTDFVVKKLKSKHPNLKLIGEYVSSNKPLTVEDELGIRYSLKLSVLLKSDKGAGIQSAIDPNFALRTKLLSVRNDISKICEKYTTARKPIIVEDLDGFKHKMSLYRLLEGSSLGFLSVIDKNAYFDFKYKTLGNPKYSRTSPYNGYHNYLKMSCPDHGIFQASPAALLTGVQCMKCFHDSNKNTLHDFIEKSNEIHKDKYDYSKAIYYGYASNNKSIITCPFHGDFEQTAKGHLSGKGCRKCANEELSGVLSSLARDNPNAPYTLYKIYLWSDNLKEKFGKVGLAKDFKQRFWGIPYNYHLVELKEGRIVDLYKEEQLFFKKRDKKGMNYRPRVKFSGYTECYQLNDEERADLNRILMDE